MKKQLINLLFIVSFLFTNNLVKAQESSMASLNFEQVNQLPTGATSSMSVYLNTNGREINSIQIRINFEGDIENIKLATNSELPIKEIARKIDTKSAFISLTATDLGKSWGTKEDTEIINLSFISKKDGQITLSFDENETLAAANDSDDNVLVVGGSQTIKIGEIIPVTEDIATTKEDIAEVTATVEAAGTTEVEEKDITAEPVNQNFLIALIALSTFGALASSFILLRKSKSKEKKDL